MTDGTPTKRDEARRIRRRWLTLGELVAVIAVVISALTFWNSWAERRDNETKSAAAEQKASTATASIALAGTADRDGKRLSLRALSDAQAIQGQTITLPSALGVSPVETTGDSRIEADWFARPLVRARKDAGLKTETGGDRRMPVMIETRFLADGDVRTARSFYDVGYAVQGGGLFGGSDVKLKGLSLIGRAPEKGAMSRLDALWKGRLAK